MLTFGPGLVVVVADVAQEGFARSIPQTMSGDGALSVAERADPGARVAVWLCGGAALLAVGLFWLVRWALFDAAYITLSYARNLATDLLWGLIASEPSNAAMSPLNVLLLGGATALLRLGGGVYPVAGQAVVVVGCAVATAW